MQNKGQKSPVRQQNNTAVDATCARETQTKRTLETAAKKDKAVPFDEELFRATAGEALCANGIDVGKYYTPAQAELYEAFFAQLFEVNAYMNLTAIRSTAEAIVKHLADSLTIAELLPQGARVIDVGCGGGFPSVPLAIARPDVSILAFDATAKKVSFVKETSKRLALANLCTAVGRAEECAHNAAYREHFDVAVSRAVANMAALCQITLPYVKRGGCVIAMKGPNGLQELSAAKGLIWQYGGAQNDVIVKRIRLKDIAETNKVPAVATINAAPLPCLGMATDVADLERNAGNAPADNADNERIILQIKKVQPTPSSLPGSWAQITKEAEKANQTNK